MAKDDTVPGLLSKMVKFVRNPATSWSELDSKEADRDEAVSKLLLKEMIERKRRNDFVRKREFDMLRKMRKREAMVGQDPGGRPSFFQSSMPSKPDDRAKTLKKIDEIEAQMSMQWWKTKQGVASSMNSGDSSNFQTGNGNGNGSSSLTSPIRPPTAPVADSAARKVPAAGLPAGYGVTEPVGLQEFGKPPIQPAARTAQAAELAPALRPPAKPLVIAGLAGTGDEYEAGASGFTHTNMMAMEVSEVAHDAELEEASIRFANGDDSGAEAGLLEMLAPGGSRSGQSETWMALFDLYRATDSQEKFETAAIRFVQKFDRSAPQWFSMPDIVRQLGKPAGIPVADGPVADWVCPSVVGIQTVAALKTALAKAPMPWRLDWTNLKTIDAVAVEPLCKIFASWAAHPVQLRFIGDTQFQQILQKNTPSGLNDTAQRWWLLRMEALRVTHRPDEFELAALDFCVTYEVSPPAWEIARCDYKSIDTHGLAIAGHTIIGDVYRDSSTASLSMQEGDTHMDNLSSQMGNLLSIELSGQIQGDAVAMLEQLEVKLMGADIMQISCARLIRVDFSAAGTLLNWVSARHAESRIVQFLEVNRLVAAFFNVIGITEYAKVISRRD